MNPIRFSKIVFRAAGIYGALALAPMYFLEQRIGMDAPPAITHPEYFYGFIGVGLAWQVMFLIISTDPVRFRPAMIAAVLEKLSFVIAVGALWAQHRVMPATVFFSCIDLLLGAFFTMSYVKLRGIKPPKPLS